MPQQYYLVDTRSTVGSFALLWGRNCAGYTTNVDALEAFSAKEAFAQNKSRYSDVPMPVAAIRHLATLAVDAQSVSYSDAGNQGEGPYLCSVRGFDGNALLFKATDGGVTCDIRDAQRFDTNETDYSRESYWREDYLLTRAQVMVRASKLSSDLLGRWASKLAPRPAPRKEKAPIYRCCGCGVFMSSQQYWMGDCSRCKADSRP